MNHKVNVANLFLRSLSPAKETPHDAVLLVGSVSRNIQTLDSDIDLIVLQKHRKRYSSKCLGFNGEKINIEFYNYDVFVKKYSSNFYNEYDLRICGRIACSQVLFGRNEIIRNLIRKCSKATLKRKDTIKLFSSLHSLLVIKLQNLSYQSTIWLLQNLTLNLSKLSLNITRGKFQKPKWLYSDLLNTKNVELINLFKTVFFLNSPPKHLNKFLLELSKEIETIAKNLELPDFYSPLTVKFSTNFNYYYLRKTYLDSISLEKAGKLLDCLFVRQFCLRLIYIMIEESGIESSILKQRICDYFITEKKVKITKKWLDHIEQMYKQLYFAYTSKWKSLKRLDSQP